MRLDSFAQEYEDIILYAILGDIEHGFYIDVGAYDPTDISVTKFFYDRGWNGINIEPIPAQCLLFEELRKRDINLCVGISNQEECKLEDATIYESGGCSTFDSSIAEEDGFINAGKSYKKVIMTLDDIYRTYCTLGQQIHFCKIDVEGYEKRVLEGIDDWNEFRPWIFVMESTRPQTLEPSYEEWEDILLNHGYSFAYHFGVNRYYIDNRREHLLIRAKKVDEFFKSNEIARMRLYHRPRKKLKENLIIFGLGEEFKENQNRILTRCHVISCSDNYSIPSDVFWKRLYKTPSDLNVSDADKILICTKKFYAEIRENFLSKGVEPDKIVDIEYLRFDKL